MDPIVISNFEEFFATQGWQEFKNHIMTETPTNTGNFDIFPFLEELAIRAEYGLYILIFISILVMFLMIRSMRS